MKLSIISLILLVAVIARTRGDIDYENLPDNPDEICRITQANNDELTAIFVFPDDTECKEFIFCVNIPGLFWIGVNVTCQPGQYVNENDPDGCSSVKPAHCD